MLRILTRLYTTKSAFLSTTRVWTGKMPYEMAELQELELQEENWWAIQLSSGETYDVETDKWVKGDN